MKFWKQHGVWYAVSGLLLAVYLAFFHWLNVAEPHQIGMGGLVFATVWLSVCFVAQSVFRNRFEFGIHTFLTLDFFMESLVPQHSGYGFYFCAVGFWTVFLIYHHLPAARRGMIEIAGDRDRGLSDAATA